MPSKHSKSKQLQQIKNVNQVKCENSNEFKINNKGRGVETITPKENNVTLAGFCAICWKTALYFCPECYLVGYCCLSHMANHWIKHKQLCEVVNKIYNKTDFIFNSTINNADDWRFIRVKTLERIKSKLDRELQPYERDVLLFPKYCSKCFQTNPKHLETCKKCHQVWYCRNELDHFPKNHEKWCENLQLFSTLVRKQAKSQLYLFDMNFGTSFHYQPVIDLKTSNMKQLLKNIISPDLDECTIAMISQAATGPLTILHALNQSNYKVKKNLTIHLIGAELHFEGKTLHAWEHFLIHFLPEIINLKIVMVGPELNAEKNCETIRLCESCSQKNKTINFEYKDKLLYHQYASSKNMSKPNIVCAFNPGFHRTTGFNQIDTWPQTIKSAVKQNCPFVFTAYTAFEAPLDLQRVQECELVHVIQKSSLNPFASLKPDRNFISDQDAPLIFKNYFMSIVTAVI